MFFKKKKNQATDGIPFLKGHSNSEVQSLKKSYHEKNYLPLIHKPISLNTPVLPRIIGRRSKEHCILSNTEAS